MRRAGIQAFEFVSARDPIGGINVALFTPSAFARKKPLSQEPWLCELTGTQVRFHAAYSRGVHEFPLEIFQVNGKLPQPAY